MEGAGIKIEASDDTVQWVGFPELAPRKIIDITRTHAMLYESFAKWEAGVWTWEQMLTNMVIILAEQNDGVMQKEHARWVEEQRVFDPRSRYMPDTPDIR